MSLLGRCASIPELTCPIGKPRKPDGTFKQSITMRTFRITIAGISTSDFANRFMEAWRQSVKNVEIIIPAHLNGEGSTVVFNATTERRKDAGDIHTAAYLIGKNIQAGLTYSVTYVPEKETISA